MALMINNKHNNSNRRNISDRYGQLEEWQQKREYFSVEIRKSKRCELLRKNRNELSSNRNPQQLHIEENEEIEEDFIDFDEETENESKPSQLISLSAAKKYPNDNNPWSSLSSRKQPNSDLINTDLLSTAIRNYLQNYQQSNFNEQLLYQQFRVDMQMKGDLLEIPNDRSIKNREYNVEVLAKTIQNYDQCPQKLLQCASIELFEYFQYENDLTNTSLKNVNYLIDIVLYQGCLLDAIQYLQINSTQESVNREELLCWLRVIGCITRGNSQHCQDLNDLNLLQIFSRYLRIFQADQEAVEILAFIIGGLSAIKLEWSYQFRLDNDHNILLQIIEAIPNTVSGHIRMVRRVCLCINIFSKDMIEEMEHRYIGVDTETTIRIPPFEYERISGLINILLGELKNDVKIVEYVFWALPLLFEMFLHNPQESQQKQQLEQVKAEEEEYCKNIENLFKKKKQIIKEISKVKQFSSRTSNPPAMGFSSIELINNGQQIIPSFENKLVSLSRNLQEISQQMKSSIEKHQNNYDSRHQFYLSTLVFRQKQDNCYLNFSNQNEEQKVSSQIDEQLNAGTTTTQDPSLLNKKVQLLVCQMRIGELIHQGLGSKDKIIIISCLRILKFLFLNGDQSPLERLIETLGQQLISNTIIFLQSDSERFIKRETIKVISALLNSALPNTIKSYYFYESIPYIMRQLLNENLQYRYEVFQLLIQQLDICNDEQFEQLIFTRGYNLFSVMKQVLRQQNEIDNLDMFDTESLITLLSFLNALLLSKRHTSGEDSAGDRLRQILKLLYTNDIVQLVKKYEDHPDDIIHHLAIHFEGIFLQMLQEDEDEELIQEISSALYEETNERSSEITPFNFPRDLR